MLIILAIMGALLLLAGLGICLINYGIALHNARRGTHSSPVPLIGTIFMVAGLNLCAPWAGDISRGLLLSVIFFDFSGLPALCLLPFALLLQKNRGDASPTAATSGGRAALIIIYMLIVGVWVLRELFLLAAGLPILQD